MKLMFSLSLALLLILVVEFTAAGAVIGQVTQAPIASNDNNNTVTSNDDNNNAVSSNDDDNNNAVASNDDNNNAVASNDDNNNAVVSNDDNNNAEASNDDKNIAASDDDNNALVAVNDDNAAGNDVEDDKDTLDNAEQTTNGNSDVDASMIRRILAELAPFLITEEKTQRGQLYCDTTKAAMQDCTIYVRATDPTIQIRQNTVMERVLIICMTTQQSCMQLASGKSLDIFTADITGNNKGRFLYMQSGAALELRDVAGYGFGSTSYEGGFIYQSGNYKVTISNSTLKNNQASNGGALRVLGGGKLTLYNTVFDANTATSHHGGAIYGTSGTWIIHKSTFKKNHGKHYGGAISAYYITATVTDTEFTDNKVYTHGGGFYLLGSTFTFQCSLFLSNIVTAYTNYGGAIYSHSSKLSLIKTMYLDNKGKTTINDLYCTGTTVTRDMDSTALATTGSCTYVAFPPTSKETDIDCTQ